MEILNDNTNQLFFFFFGVLESVMFQILIVSCNR